MVRVVVFVAAMVVGGFEGPPVIRPPTTVTISDMWRIVVSRLFLVSATPPIRVRVVVMGRGFVMGHMTHQGSGRSLMRRC